MLPLKVQSMTQTHSHRVPSGSNFYGRVNKSPHDGIAAPGTSNPRPFGYESYALTNCAITARPNMTTSDGKHFCYQYILGSKYWSYFSK